MKIQYAIITLSLMITGTTRAVESLNPVDQLPALVSTSSDDSTEEANKETQSSKEESTSRPPTAQPKETKTNPRN